MSSRRSSSQTSAPRWSTLAKAKKQDPATSVSKVFAKPQQGSRLRSAIDQLPAAVLDDAASIRSTSERKRERRASEGSSMNESTVVGEPGEEARKRARVGAVSPEDEVAATPVGVSTEDVTKGENDGRPVIHLQPMIDAPTMIDPPPNTALTQLEPTTSTVQSPPIPFPKSPAQSPAQDAQLTAPRSSWLGSWSRAMALERLLKSDEGTADAKLQASSSSSYSHGEITIRVQPGSPVTEQSAADLTGRGRAESAPPMRRGQDRPTVPDTPLPQSDSLNSMSSIDEEVPPPKLTVSGTQSPPSALAVVRSDEGMTCERKPSVSSLNPSTSRFSLRLPLLGKSTLSSSSGARSVSSEETEKREDEDSTRLAESPENSPEPVTDSPQAPQESTQPSTSGHRPTSSTWWDYVPGWSNQQPESGPVGPRPSNEGAATDAGDSSPDSASQRPLVPSAVQSPGSATPTATTTAPAPSPAPEPAPLGRKTSEGSPKARQTQAASEQKPASLFSADTAKSQGSVWYSPWAWYSPAPKPSSETATAAESQPVDDEEQPAKTESELVKERALARDESPPAPDPAAELEPAKPEPTPTSESRNPIEETVTTHRSGWMSFFVSRAMAYKAITDEATERDENGLEVMHIDDDEPAPQAVQAPVIALPADKQVPTNKQVPVPERQPSPAPSTNSQSVPPKREPKKSNGPVSTPPTTSESIKRDVRQANARSPSPAPSKASGVSSPTAPRPQPPNLILPTWEDTFRYPPRSYVAPPPKKAEKTKLSKTLSFVSGVLFHKDEAVQGTGKGKERAQEPEFLRFGQDLPKALDVLEEQLHPYIVNGGCRVVVIGVAGWMPGPVTRAVAGGLPSSSSKFVNMTVQALEQFEQEYGFRFKKITKIPLEGDGTIERKVAKVHDHLLSDEDWMEDLHAADVIIIATHSQGSIISTHLVDRLIADGHILTARSVDSLRKTATAIATGTRPIVPPSQAQKVCFLALCGIHLGPLRYLRTSSLLQPYIQYFENAAARELFEFQNTETQSSKDYVEALKNLVSHGAKMVYVASLNDQVVPIYSGLFTAASHPRILRALYIDGDAYHSSDFLSNLLVLLIRIKNAGLSDSGLLAHLSEATAGTLSGVGHSTAYEEPATFSLAVKYFFLSNDGDCSDKELVVDSFNAVNEQNDYEIPWALRDVIADERVAHLFAREFAQLRDAFDEWQPKTSILREVKRKLQPIQRLSSIIASSNHGHSPGSLSKL